MADSNQLAPNNAPSRQDRKVPMHKPFVLIFLISAVSLAYFPSLSSNVEYNDDHTILRWAHRNQIHEQIPDPPLGIERFINDSFGRGRCLPVSHAVWYTQTVVFGNEIFLYRLFWLVAAVTTSTLFYIIANRLLDSDYLSLLFALSVGICPAAADVWPYLIRGESIGLFLIAITLFCVTGDDKSRPFLDVAGPLAFLLACLSKESFFLLAPAIAALNWTWLQAPSRQPSSFRRLVVSLAYLAVGCVVGLLILLNTLSAGSESHGGRSLQQGIAMILSNLFSRDGITVALLSNSLFLLPFITGLASVAFQATKTNREAIKKSAIIIGLWVIPQLLIYSTRQDFSPRYAFPALIALLFLNVWGLKQLNRLSNRWPFRFLVLLMALWLLRCGQIQFFEARNLAEETQAIDAAIKIVAESARNQNRPVLIIGPPKTEQSLSVLVALAARVGPELPVFLYQPEGTDGNLFGFENRVVLDSFDEKSFCCAIAFNLTSKAAYLKFPSWTNVSISFQRSYLSLRKGKVEAFNASLSVLLPPEL